MILLVLAVFLVCMENYMDDVREIFDSGEAGNGDNDGNNGCGAAEDDYEKILIARYSMLIVGRGVD